MGRESFPTVNHLGHLRRCRGSGGLQLESDACTSRLGGRARIESLLICEDKAVREAIYVNPLRFASSHQYSKTNKEEEGEWFIFYIYSEKDFTD